MQISCSARVLSKETGSMDFRCGEKLEEYGKIDIFGCHDHPKTINGNMEFQLTFFLINKVIIIMVYP